MGVCFWLVFRKDAEGETLSLLLQSPLQLKHSQ